jgi:hypothetical protein
MKNSGSFAGKRAGWPFAPTALQPRRQQQQRSSEAKFLISPFSSDARAEDVSLHQRKKLANATR